MANNIKEYVVNKVLQNMDETEKLKLELKKANKKIDKMKKLLKSNNICFECVCSKCKRKIPESDSGHSHNTDKIYPTLCYRCFFQVLLEDSEQLT